MPPHDFPFLLIQCAWLEQDGIRYAQLANVMQQRTAPNVDQLLVVKTKRTRQFKRQVGNALCMPFRFIVAQVKRT
jgi:hypothetical protein